MRGGKGAGDIRERSGDGMATVQFTPMLKRHVEVDCAEVPAGTLRNVLEGVFRENPRLRGYILDDQGALREHVSVFVDGRRVADRRALTDPVSEQSVVYVLQALSGG